MCMKTKSGGSVRHINTIPNFGGFARVETLKETWIGRINKAGGIPAEAIAERDNKGRIHWFKVQCKENEKLYVVCLRTDNETRVVTTEAPPPVHEVHNRVPLIAKEEDVRVLRTLTRKTNILETINKIRSYQGEIRFVPEQRKLELVGAEVF